MIRADIVVLLISLVLLLAERLGRLTRLCGTHSLIVAGAVLAASRNA